MEFVANLTAKPDEALIDAFEDALNALPDAAIIGSADTAEVRLVFTVDAPRITAAAITAAYLIENVGVPVAEDMQLSVEVQGE